MRANSSKSSGAAETVCHTMEAGRAVGRSAGLRGDCRQMGKGSITGRWRTLPFETSSLLSLELDNSLQSSFAPPEGCVTLAMVPSPVPLLIEGEELGGNRVLVHDAETHVVVPAGARLDMLVLPRTEFEASGSALFPRSSLSGDLTGLISCPPAEWASLRDELEDLLTWGDAGSERASRVLSGFLNLIGAGSEPHKRKVAFGNGSTRHVAKRAQEYIEDQYAGPIRIEDLCRHTGASMSTLNRSFRHYFQVSPYRYIQICRLDGARRALRAGDRSRDQVTRIAFDHGFRHLGRFSVEYREHFGESPRDTLAGAH